jgi:hypothetical protein
MLKRLWRGTIGTLGRLVRHDEFHPVATVTDVGTGNVLFEGNPDEADQVMTKCCGHGQTLRLEVRWVPNKR